MSRSSEPFAALRVNSAKGKHLTPQRARPFAALRVTLVSNLCERLWVAPARTAGLLGQGFVLRVDAANFSGLGDAGDGEQIGAHAQVGLLLGGFTLHSMESTRHDGFEPVIDFVFGPEEALQVLHPLEVTDGDTTGIGHDVGDDCDAAIIEDTISLGCGWAVGGFNNQAGLYAWSVSRGQLVLPGGRHQDIALELQQ